MYYDGTMIVHSTSTTSTSTKPVLHVVVVVRGSGTWYVVRDTWYCSCIIIGGVVLLGGIIDAAVVVVRPCRP